MEVYNLPVFKTSRWEVFVTEANTFPYGRKNRQIIFLSFTSPQGRNLGVGVGGGGVRYSACRRMGVVTRSPITLIYTARWFSVQRNYS